MTRLTYLKAIDDVLRPLGFERGGRQWTRIRGEIEEKLDLQKIWIDGGVTVNVWAKDLETQRILRTITCDKALGIRHFGVRIGSLIDGHDRWWKSDPNGPSDLAETVRAFAVPWFDRVTTLEAQASEWYGRGTQRPWRKPNLAALAVTLFRLGAVD